MATSANTNRELLKVFYFVALFIALTLITFRLLGAFGVETSIGIDRTKYIAVLGSLAITMATAQLYLKRLNRPPQP